MGVCFMGMASLGIVCICVWCVCVLWVICSKHAHVIYLYGICIQHVCGISYIFCMYVWCMVFLWCFGVGGKSYYVCTNVGICVISVSVCEWGMVYVCCMCM